MPRPPTFARCAPPGGHPSAFSSLNDASHRPRSSALSSAPPDDARRGKPWPPRHYPRPVDITLRPLTTDDIPAWAHLLGAIEKVDRTGEHYRAADLEEEMANPEIEVGKDIVGAFDSEVLVGYFSILPRGEGEGHFKVHVQGSVLPERRGEGIGTLLVEAMLARAEQAHAERRPDLPARLTTTGLSSDEAQADLLSRAGMSGERWNFVMRTRSTPSRTWCRCPRVTSSCSTTPRWPRRSWRRTTPRSWITRTSRLGRTRSGSSSSPSRAASGRS